MSCIAESCTADRRQAQAVVVCAAEEQEHSRWSWVVDQERSTASLWLLRLIGPQPTDWDPEGKGVRDFVSITHAEIDPDGEDRVREVTVHVKSGVRGVLFSATGTTSKTSVEGMKQDLRCQLMMRVIALHEATDSGE